MPIIHERPKFKGIKSKLSLSNINGYKKWLNMNWICFNPVIFNIRVN